MCRPKHVAVKYKNSCVKLIDNVLSTIVSGNFSLQILDPG